MEVDINLLLEKEKNKILKQRERDAQNAKDKAEKKVKKGERAGKSKAVATSNFPPLLTETSTTTSS
jgi:adenylate kinase